MSSGAQLCPTIGRSATVAPMTLPRPLLDASCRRSCILCGRHGKRSWAADETRRYVRALPRVSHPEMHISHCARLGGDMILTFRKEVTAWRKEQLTDRRSAPD